MTALGDKIAAEAVALQGTPFMHQGRNPAVGLDCVGLVHAACAAAGAAVDDFRAYPPCPSPAVLLRELRVRFREVGRPSVGDVVVLRDSRTGAARHVGILCGERSIAVSDERHGVRVRDFGPRMMLTAFRNRRVG